MQGQGGRSARRRAVPRAVSSRPVRAVLLPLLLFAACARSDERWVAALADPDPFERALAAFALCEQAPARAPAALDVLLETIDRSELGLEPIAAQHLKRVALTVPDTLRARLDADPVMTRERRRALVEALEEAARRRRER